MSDDYRDEYTDRDDKRLNRDDLIEAREALERALDRWYDDQVGSARSHIQHALAVLERILARDKR